MPCWCAAGTTVGLSLFEVPELAVSVVNARAWLPARIAKGGAARHVYFPASVLRNVLDYVEMERAEAVQRGRAAGVYERMRDPFVVEDPSRPRVRLDGRWEPVTKLDASERLRLLIDTGAGLENVICLLCWLCRGVLVGLAEMTIERSLLA